jgi:AraC family transcriptional regulator
MEYRIKNKPVFKLIGYELKTSNEDGQNNKEIPAFWAHYLEQKKYERIPNAVHRDSPVELGVCLDFDPDARTFSYIIGMEAEHFDNVPEDLVCREIPQASYAVFTTPKVKPEDFTASIQSTWMTIFGEWFPNSGYEHSGGPEFEWYDERCHRQKHELIQTDIYIPVRKKTS